RHWRGQHFRLLEKNVTKPTANENAKKRGSGNEITNLCYRQIGVTAPRQKSKEGIAASKGEHISQSVPARTDIVPQSKNQRAKIVNVVSDHAGNAERDYFGRSAPDC